MNDYTIPRRDRLDLHTPAELAIRDAVDAVEAAGAHPHLTKAVVLLAEARNAVADFVDGVPVSEPPAPSALDLIAAERKRQISKGYDAAHEDGALAAAAASFAAVEGKRTVRFALDLWPFSGGYDTERTGLENLVCAGALIVAEIERLQRRAAAALRRAAEDGRGNARLLIVLTDLVDAVEHAEVDVHLDDQPWDRENIRVKIDAANRLLGRTS